ncbi:MAG: hypothetical protein WCN95_02215 [bacterium]
MRKFALLFAAVVAFSPLASWAQDENQDVDDDGDGIEAKQEQMSLDRHWSDLQAHKEVQKIDIERQWNELNFRKEMQKIELEKARGQIRPGMQMPMGFQGGRPMDFPRHHSPCMFAMMAICMIVHVLLAIWVFQDVRKRNSGSGIWIAVVLLTGFFGALLYAIVRLGDIRASGTAA